MHIILQIMEYDYAIFFLMIPDNNEAEHNQRPQRSLRIVDSAAGVDRWHALWDWLLTPDPPTKPTARESDVANGDSQGSHTNHKPGLEQTGES